MNQRLDWLIDVTKHIVLNRKIKEEKLEIKKKQI